jgi:outer membrane receptor protein involved in Fe transport
LAVGTAQRDPTSVPDRVIYVQRSRERLARIANTGAPLASLLLGQVQTFSIDLQQQMIEERAHFQAYFIQDDWKVSDRFTVNPGLRYTLNFPSTEIHGQTAIFNVQTQQLEYPGTNPVRPLKKNNVGPRLGAVYRLTDKTILSSGYGLVWIEMAGITTPFTTPTFPFLQTVSQRTLDNITPAFVLQNGPTVAPIAPTPDAGLGQGVFAVDRTLGSGSVQQWYVGIIPRSSSLGDPTIPVAQLLKPYPESTTVSLYRDNVGTTRYQGLELSLRQRLAHGLSFNRALERDNSTGDMPHVLVSSVVWDLPAGKGRARQLHGLFGAIANDWTVTSLVTLQSGTPIAVTQSNLIKARPAPWHASRFS